MKSKTLCYAVWLFGGVFGLHHLYLRRYRHAFLWFATFGGFFGLGLLRETWRLSDYVDEYNINFTRGILRRSPIPSFSTIRLAGGFVTGVWFGTVLHGSIPEEAFTALPGLGLIGCLGAVIGVCLVANLGHQTCDIKPVLWSVLLAILYSHLSRGDDSQIISTTAFFSTLAACQWRKWKPESYRPASCPSGTLVFTLCAVTYMCLFTSLLLHSVTVTNRYGESVKLRDAVGNFLNSPAWEDTKETFRGFYKELREEGFAYAWREVMISLDPDGEDYAMKLLGVDSSATEKDITVAYRALAKKWHPDRHKDPQMKIKAEERFQEINKAYETLSSIKTRRASNNLKSRVEL